MPYPTGRSRRRPHAVTTVAAVPVDLLGGAFDFTTWTQNGVYGMSDVTADSFTNEATAGIAKDIGAVAGETYRIVIDQTRGSGALRMYLSDDGTIDTSGNDVVEPAGGLEEFTVTAAGPYLTFRASVGNTTTVVTKLEVYQVG